MPAAQRQQPPAVIQRLLEQPHRFGFFQALRLLERWVRQQEGLSSAQVLSQRLAVRNPLSLSFPASEIAHLELEGSLRTRDGVPQSDSVQRVAITPAFIGLLGGGGALPNYYTELFAERETYHRDRAGRAFLDIFLHRASVLFYQAWQKHRLPVQFEADRRQRYLPLVLSLAGLGHAGVRDRLLADTRGVADDALAHFAGTLQRRPLSATTLQRMLAQHFNVPVQLDQFVGRWFTLPDGNQSHLGQKNMQLGRDMVMGERVWQRDLRMRLTFGPMPRERFLRFLPGGSAAVSLAELLALMTGGTLEFEIRLTLRAEDVQGTTLDAQSSARLGWTSFLTTEPTRDNRSDVGYDLLALA